MTVSSGPERGRGLRRLGAGVGAAIAGAAGALVALLVDAALARLFLGRPPAVEIRFLPPLALWGAIVAGIVWAASRRRAGTGALAVYAFAGAYLPELVERVVTTLVGYQGRAIAYGLAAVGLALAAIWGAVLARLSGSPARGAGWLGLTIALGLAVNRYAVDLVLSPPALLADAATVAALALLAWLSRRLPARALTAVVAAGVVAAALLIVQPPLPPPTPPRRGGPPDLVLLVFDTTRKDVFDAVLAETVEGRALARHFDDAVWFDHAVAASPWTAPSMGSILTGLYPIEHGFGFLDARDHARPLRPMSKTVTPLAQSLHEDGYRTEALIANTLLHPFGGLDRGFDRFDVLGGEANRLPVLSGLSFAGVMPRRPYGDARRVRAALERVSREVAAVRRPYFLWLHLMDPHRPYRPHDDLEPDPGAAGLGEDERLYRDEVRYAAVETAAMLDLLDRELAARQRAIVVLVADHGEMFPSDDVGDPEHPRGVGHGHAYYRPLMRVPLAIRPPGGLPGGRRVAEMVSHVDLHDALLDLLGSSAPRVRGPSRLTPWLATELPEGVEPPRGETLLSGIGTKPGDGPRGLETSRFKLILHRSEGAEADLELFDVQADPHERRNLAALRPALVARLEAELARLWAAQVPAPDQPGAVVDPGLREQLRALGYLQP